MNINLEVETSDPKLVHLANIFDQTLSAAEKWEELRRIGLSKSECGFSVDYAPWDSEIVFANVVDFEQDKLEIEFDLSSTITYGEYLNFIKKLSGFINGEFNVSVWHDSDVECIDKFTFISGEGDEVGDPPTLAEEPEIELLKGKEFFYIPVDGDDVDDVLRELITDTGGRYVAEMHEGVGAVITNKKTPRSVIKYAKSKNVKMITSEKFLVDLVGEVGGQALIDQFTTNIFMDALRFIGRWFRKLLKVVVYLVVAVVVFNIVFGYVTNR